MIYLSPWRNQKYLFFSLLIYSPIVHSLNMRSQVGWNLLPGRCTLLRTQNEALAPSRVHRKGIYEVGEKNEIHHVLKMNVPKGRSYSAVALHQSDLCICWQIGKSSQEQSTSLKFFQSYFSLNKRDNAEAAARPLEFLSSGEFKAEFDGETINIQWYFTKTSCHRSGRKRLKGSHFTLFLFKAWEERCEYNSKIRRHRRTALICFQSRSCINRIVRITQYLLTLQTQAMKLEV